LSPVQNWPSFAARSRKARHRRGHASSPAEGSCGGRSSPEPSARHRVFCGKGSAASSIPALMACVRGIGKHIGADVLARPDQHNRARGRRRSFRRLGPCLRPLFLADSDLLLRKLPLPVLSFHVIFGLELFERRLRVVGIGVHESDWLQTVDQLSALACGKTGACLPST
jgi:uncharacterized low-complexity protein